MAFSLENRAFLRDSGDSARDFHAICVKMTHPEGSKPRYARKIRPVLRIIQYPKIQNEASFKETPVRRLVPTAKTMLVHR